MSGQDENSKLSKSTLDVLKQFATENGVQIQDELGMDETLSSIHRYFALSKEEQEDHFDIDYTSKDQSINVKFNIKGVKRELGQILDSTGLTIWRAAEHLCQFIVDNIRIFSGKSVCELGCGLGMVSILLEKVYISPPGFQSIALNQSNKIQSVSLIDSSIVEQSDIYPPRLIVATDGDQATLDLLNENIESTGSTILSTKLYWGDVKPFLDEFPESFDILLAADVIYEEEQIRPLIDTVSQILMKPDGVFYLAYARRNVPIDKVFVVVEEYGLQYHAVDERGLEPIYAITWRSDS